MGIGDMKEGFVFLNTVPIHVLTWGGWIDDPEKSEWKEMVVLFTGNPGVTAFYSEYLSIIHEKLNMPVWVISHGGHELPLQRRSMPRLRENTSLFNLEGQIQQKREFFETYIPENCKVHLLSHSIGSYMALQLMKDDHIADRVQMLYLLFPTLEHMAATPNGQFYTKVAEKFLWLIYWLTALFHFLPHTFGMLLLNIYFRIFGTGTSQSVMDAVMQLLNPRVMRFVFFLASDEMVNVNELDVDTITKRKNKLLFYYGTRDKWAPLSYYERLVKSVPGVKALVCARGIDHAFMLHKPSLPFANITISLIQSNRVQ